jgi:hypothetical protein
MNFKTFLKEEIESGPMLEIGPDIKEKINIMFMLELEDPLLTPQAGFLKIRKVLELNSIDVPAVYDLDSEGDETVIELDSENYLYILYYLTDDGYYDFYAEVTDENSVQDLLDSGTEEEEQE